MCEQRRPQAGVISLWTPPEGEPAMLTCSILTRAAEGPAADVHDHMPVILPQPAHSTWLHPEQTDAGKVLGIAREVAVTQVAEAQDRVSFKTSEILNDREVDAGLY